MTEQDMTDPAPTGSTQFIEYAQPGLKAGDYQISVVQTIESRESNKIPKSTFSTTSRFSVFSERFALNPTDIHALFPPEGSLGEYSATLPHMILNRSTLPWERSPNYASEAPPWLALLLFDEEEAPAPQIVTVKDLTQQGAGRFPPLQLERGQQEEDRVVIIEATRRLLELMLPSLADLKLLAHVRRATTAQGTPEGNDLAVVIGNRLPKQGGISVVHLVSLEDRYPKGSFDYQDAGPDELVRLVSLKSWRFACVDEKQSFAGLLTSLNAEPSMLRLPASQHPVAESYLASGCVPLRHSLRQGDTTVSWYHGPLIPAEHTSEIALPADAADELMRYSPSIGMFDVSYAAAWELGRLLALQSTAFSVSLYQWKRAHAQQLRQAEQRLLHSYLPIVGQPVTAGEMPTAVTTWLDNLRCLQGVPFRYLVPDDQMLPPESIRFFWVDHLWIDCLLDGAFSMGRIPGADHGTDHTLPEQPAFGSQEQVTGFLLRSDVVAGWPGLHVDAYDLNGGALKPLRMDRLSAQVLLCCFKGEMHSVAIHQRPETLHFGLDRSDDNQINPGHPHFFKQVKNSQGQESQTKIDPLPWKDEARRVLNVHQLATALNSPTSAHFALQMLEGVPKVIFSKLKRSAPCSRSAPAPARLA